MPRGHWVSVKLGTETRGGDSDLSHRDVLGAHRLPGEKLEEGEGEDLHRASGTPAFTGQEADKCEQRGGGATGEGGVLEAEGISGEAVCPSVRPPGAAGQPGDREDAAGLGTSTCEGGTDMRWDPAGTR